jgi:hypothetical protein
METRTHSKKRGVFRKAKRVGIKIKFKKMKKLLLSISTGVAILFIMSIFIFPEPNKEYSGFWYGWLAGAFHGALIIPNWIISIFDESRQIKATTFSGWYNFNWWFCSISQVFTVFLKPILAYIKSSKEA